MIKRNIKYIFCTFSILLTVSLFGVVFNSIIKQAAVAEGEIAIYTLQDLDAVRNDLTADYILMNDLDFYDDSSYDQTDPDWATKKASWVSGEGWIPVGNITTSFSGTFDGNGYTISNLYINRSTETYIGLFGVLSSQGLLHNLGVINIDIEGDEYVGGLTGSNSGTMSNVYTSGTVTGTSKVGGLIGSSSGAVSDSYSLCIVDGDGTTGGLIGENLAGGIITNASWNGLLTATGYYIGGLVGVNNINATINTVFLLEILLEDHM